MATPTDYLNRAMQVQQDLNRRANTIKTDIEALELEAVKQLEELEQLREQAITTVVDEDGDSLEGKEDLHGVLENLSSPGHDEMKGALQGLEDGLIGSLKTMGDGLTNLAAAITDAGPDRAPPVGRRRRR